MKTQKCTINLLLFTIILLVNSVGTALAQEIAMQGILRNQSGRAVEDGTYALTFKFYDAVNGGNVVWSETQPNVMVSQGIYSVYLGEVTPLNAVPFDRQYWLGIAINGGQELSPRVKLARNPYALGILGISNVFTSNGNVGIGTTNPTEKFEIVGNAKLSGNLGLSNGSSISFSDGTSLTTGALSQVRSDQWVDFFVNKADNSLGNLHMRFGSAEEIKYNFTPTALFATNTQWISNGTEINSDFGGHRQYFSLQRGDLNRWTVTTINPETGGDAGVGGNDLLFQRFTNGGGFAGDHMMLKRNGTTVFGGGAITNDVINNQHQVKIFGSATRDYAHQVLNLDMGDNQQLAFWRDGSSSPIIENTGGHIIFGTWNIGDIVRNVGIGDTSPLEAKLVVSGFASNGFGHGNEHYKWEDNQITGGQYGLSHPQQGTLNYNLSIWASDGISGNFYVVYSDKRTKDVIGQSNTSTDLKTLNSIKITDYTLKDVVNNGNREFKKVIAQQVEEVYPTAVVTTSGFIPNIYSPAKEVEFLSGNLVQVTLEKAHELTTNDFVKVWGLTQHYEVAVAKVIDEHTFQIEMQKDGDKLFVYGKKVDDFKSVDYEAISMLNVSATQELYKQVVTLQNQLEQLKKENTTLKGNYSAINDKVNQLGKLVEGLVGQNKESFSASNKTVSDK
jgi:hypothetical protein